MLTCTFIQNPLHQMSDGFAHYTNFALCGLERPDSPVALDVLAQQGSDDGGRGWRLPFFG